MKNIPISAMIGLAFTALYFIIAVFAPFLAPYGMAEVVGDVWEPSSSDFWLGTDNIGRDLLSRMIYGGRTTIFIATAATILSFVTGSILGFLAAVLGGWADQVMSRTVDLIMSIPSLIFIIAVLDSTRVFRLTRAVAMNVVVMEYVEAARLRGEGLGWVMRREILPNIMPPLVAEFGLRFCFVFLTIAALSFLGVGIQPPTADWGSMVRDNASLIQFAQYDLKAGITPLLPAGAIALLTIAVNFVVDWFLMKTSGLRDEV